MLARFGIVKSLILVCLLASCNQQRGGSGCTIPPADLRVVWPVLTDSIRILDEAGGLKDYNFRLEPDTNDSQTLVIVPGNSLVGALPFPMILSDGKRLIVLEGDLFATACGSDCMCYRYSSLRGEGIASVDSAGEGYYIRIDPGLAGQ